MSEASKEVIRQAVARLEAIGESIKRQASESGEVVRHAVEEVKALETLMKVGASETFLGSSLMMVGVTQWPLSKSAMDEKYAPPLGLTINGQQVVEFHGDPKGVRSLEGRYKAILLLYKVD